MSILFTDIYAKAIDLFDDPKITKAYKTNKTQFAKIMYNHLRNAIAMFNNPASIGVMLAQYNEPSGTMAIFEGDGYNSTFTLDDDFEVKDNSIYTFIQDRDIVHGEFDAETRQVSFPEILPVGHQYAFEQYYVGEFTSDFSTISASTKIGDQMVVNQIKDILARLLVKAWAEGERNNLLDIRNLMQDSDFKRTGNDRILNSKDKWISQLDDEMSSMQNKLSWNIRFMKGSQNIGRG